LLILLFILAILNLFTPFLYQEGFQSKTDKTQLNPDTVQSYNNFLAFYNPFCASWQKGIVSSIAADTPQEPLASPSQESNSTAPTATPADMNMYITQLSQQLGQSLPPICTSMPDTIDSTNITEIVAMIPTDTAPYINALNWMNEQLSKSQANLGSALQGGKPQVEGFVDPRSSNGSMCKNISACLANNPDLVAELAQELSAQNAQQVAEQEKQLIAAISPFLTSSDLTSAFQQNTELLQKAQDIQDQAQSGELVNQINVPGGNTKAQYTIPPGGDTLSQMQKNNPQRYNELKSNYSAWASIKGLMEQINSTL
jgi:hypothetical protein